jgi:hypothetical protein
MTLFDPYSIQLTPFCEKHSYIPCQCKCKWVLHWHPTGALYFLCHTLILKFIYKSKFMWQNSKNSSDVSIKLVYTNGVYYICLKVTFRMFIFENVSQKCHYSINPSWSIFLFTNTFLLPWSTTKRHNKKAK